MFLQWQGLVLLYKWQEPNLCMYPSRMGPFHIPSSGLVLGIYEKFQLSVALRVVRCGKYSFNS